VGIETIRNWADPTGALHRPGPAPLIQSEFDLELKPMRIASTLALFFLAATCLVSACATQSPGAAPGGRGGIGPAGRGDPVAVGGRGRGGARGGVGRGRGATPLSPDVQIRSYRFEETGEMLEYAVYVSSQVKKDSKKVPLVIALHGRGAHPTTIIQRAQSSAERGGYIVAAPMGYNDHGWYGLLESERSTPPNVREYSEKDVMNVLSFMRAEFDIDENRIYLMGTSMGGAGVLFLAVKHPDIWAAVAAGAPPLRRATHGETIEGIANIRHLPVMLVHGERDAAVTVEVSRRLAGRMQQLGMTHEYREIPGGTHPDAGRVGAPWMFSFFDRHTKSSAPPTPGLLSVPSPAAQPMNGTVTGLPRELRNGTATIEQVRAWMQAEHVKVFPEIPVEQVTFAVREQDLDFDGIIDVLMQRYVTGSGEGPYSAFLTTSRGYRFIGTFYGAIRPLPVELGQPSRFVIASAMGSARMHVRFAELKPDGLHQVATAILAAGDSGTVDGNRLYRELMSAQVVSWQTLSQIFGSAPTPR
jgi:dienelactone hydrolase